MLGKRRGWRALGVAGAAIVVMLGLAASAGAAAPEFVLRIFDDRVQMGSGAGELRLPSGAVADPGSGHLFVSEEDNGRISEYTSWGLFVKSWGWGVLDGASELQVCGPAEPSDAPPPTLCRGGSEGGGTGQLRRASGIAMDPAGDLYVLERLNRRVQKFSDEGEFLVMFGGKVNKTKVEEGAPAAEQNRCPVAPADVCQAGTGGTASGSFSEIFGDTIEYSPSANAILVGDEGRIQEFNLDGSFKGEIPFSAPGPLEAFAGKLVRGLDVGPDGNTYLTIGGLADIYKLSPAGAPLDPGKPGASGFAAPGPSAVTVDHDNNVFAVSGSRVLEFDSAADQLVPSDEEEGAGVFFPNLPQNPQLRALTTNLCVGSPEPGSLYVAAALPAATQSYVDLYGSPPIGCDVPPIRPPVIASQYATSVKTDIARVRAEINPRFWDDTTFFVQYGEGKCSEGGCDKEQPLGPGSILTDKVVNKVLATPSIVLGGLEPGTTYHYRFVAQSSGGGPVFGIDPDGPGSENPEEADQENGLEGTLTTFAPPPGPDKCPANDAFRGGPSGRLPDCRAYELVSPLDKEGGDAALLPSSKVFFEVNQSATAGDGFTYSSITPFSDPEGAPFIVQLLADRDPESGWSNRSISPPRSARVLDLLRSLNNEFKGFSADLCMGWMRHNSASTLTPEAIPGFANAYRRDNCSASPAYEALSTVEPPVRPPDAYTVNPLGFSDDGTKSVFVADDKLTEDAPTLKPEELLLYMHNAGGLRFVCRLPNGDPITTACGPGMLAIQPDGRSSAVQNAVSGDGSRVFWTAFSGSLIEFGQQAVPGKIYVRLNPDREQSPVSGGVCTDAELACTIAVSQSVTSEASEYWSASEDGSKAIFRVAKGPLAGNLYEFDVETKTPTLIAEGVEGPLGMSEDASHVYFSSSKALAPGGSEGAHNLYHHEAGEGGGSTSFIMGLADTDLLGSDGRPGAVNEVPLWRSATVSPDGLHAAFTSAASPTPTGYDNTDVVSGEPDEVAYLYDAAADQLRCISCNPTGARPVGVEGKVASLAARLAAPRSPLHYPNTLSDDGNRVFFESFEALVPRDTNGTWDVYQWEAPGTGSCDEGDAAFGAASGGCVELISSGESPAASRFLDADPSGANVFIGTQSSLVGYDFGLSDVYVARVGGGFPEPAGPAPECEGEACQSPPPPPADVTPASSAFEGPGNLPAAKPKPRPRRCAKGKHRARRKGKARCVKKRAAHKSRKARSERRAGR